MNAKFLLRGNIIGIIDSYGAAHSQFTGGEIKTHEELYPMKSHARWRWNHSESLHWFLAEHKPSDEECEIAQKHLTRKYGLKWWSNGHHDIDDLLKRAKK